MFHYLPLLLAFCCVAQTTTAQFPLELKNNCERAAAFQFFAKELKSWEPGQLHLYSGQTGTKQLRSKQAYTIVFRDVPARYSEYWEDVRLYDLAEEASQQTPPGPVLFTRLSRTEMRTKTYQVVKMVPEEKTKTVVVVDPVTGQRHTEERTYTVMVPYHEEKTVEYEIEIPLLRMSVGMGDAERVIGEVTGVHGALLQRLDPRERYLGVGLGDAPENGGAVVTSVAQGSPGQQMRRVGRPDTERYTFTPGRDVITQVNWEPVKNSAEAREKVQASPPTVVLTVYDRETKQTHDHEADLKLLNPR